jgi:hypothetical protein
MKYVGQINDNKDVVTKEYIDSKTNVLFTSVTDEFNDISKISINSNLVQSAGKIRSTITKYDSDGNSINVYATSPSIQVTDGDVFVYTNSTGFNPSTASGYSTANYYTQPIFLQSATQIAVTPTFTEPSDVSGWSAPLVRSTINASSLAEHLTCAINVEDNQAGNNRLEGVSISNSTVRATLDMGTLSSAKLTVSKQGATSNELTYNATSVAINSDANIRNLAMASDGTYVYVAYPFNASQYKVRRYNYSNLNVDANELTIGITSGTSAQKIDMYVENNRLHIIGSFGTATPTRVVHYFYRDIASGSWGTTTTAEVQLLSWASSAIVPYSVQLVPTGSNNRLGWCAFSKRSSTSSCIHFGIINTAATSGTYQYRTATQGAISSLTQVVGGLTYTSTTCNGVGTMVYDSVNQQFILIWASNPGTTWGFLRVGVAVDSAFTNFDTITTSATGIGGVTNRDIRAFIVPSSNTTRTIDVILADNTRVDLIKTTFSVTSAGVFTYVANSTTLLYRYNDGLASVAIGSITVVPETILEQNYKYAIYYQMTRFFHVQIFSVNIGYIKPTLRLEIVRPASGSHTAIGGGEEIEIPTSEDTYTFTFPYTSESSVVLRFEFFLPVLTTRFSGTTYSVTLTSFVVEQILPTSEGLTGFFESTALITNRVVKKVTLDALQTIPAISGNGIVWKVRALNGATWRTIDYNSGTHEFVEVEQGSYLQVKAEFTRGSTATALNQVPSVESYQVSVSDVVTTGDILPLQINLMKLGLNVTALTTASRYNYNNMMIDTFETSNGVSSLGNITHSNHNGTLTNTTGSPVTITTTIENADIAEVKNLVLVAEHTGNMTFRISRDNGTTYSNITKEQIFDFVGNESAKNKIVLEATFPSGAVCYGWAYVYA